MMTNNESKMTLKMNFTLRSTLASRVTINGAFWRMMLNLLTFCSLLLHGWCTCILYRIIKLLIGYKE